jgi:hypothetical protein
MARIYMPQLQARLVPLFLLVTACPALPAPGDEQGDDTMGGLCAPRDAFGTDICEVHSGVFTWNGTKCEELCEPEACTGEDCDELFDGAEACFSEHRQCIDEVQCHFGLEGLTDVSGELDVQAHPELGAGVFFDQSLLLGPDPIGLGAYLFSELRAYEISYPQVVSISSDTAWSVGVHPVSIMEIGSWNSTPGTVTIESVSTEGTPDQWRLRGTVVADDPVAFSGTFEVAGCVR